MSRSGSSPFSAGGFEGDAEREVAFRKWSQWQSQQKALAGTAKP
jgi:hypothetical protein